MKFHPLSFQVSSNRKAIFWALLSQTIWLPVFVAGSQEEWAGQASKTNLLSGLDTVQKPLVRDQFNPTTKILGSGTRQLQSYTQISKQNTGLVLNARLPNQQITSPEPTKIYPAANSATNKLLIPALANPTDTEKSSASTASLGWLAIKATRPGLYASAGLTQRMYSRSELLGGTLTLQDLNEPVMPPLARAERAQWSRSGDPLASLPQIWREPMRRALNSLTQTVVSTKVEKSGKSVEGVHLDPARFVHVPSTRIRHSSEVPLALQADGSVDILNQPDDPAVIDEINRWSARQKLPEKGKISPAVVHLHPMEPLEVGRSAGGKTNTQSIETSKLRTSQTAPPLSPTTEPSAVSRTATTETQPAASRRPSGEGLTTAPVSSAAPVSSGAPVSSAVPVSSGAPISSVSPAPVSNNAPTAASETES